MKFILLDIAIWLCIMPLYSCAQQPVDKPAHPNSIDRIIDFPSKFFSKIQGKTATLDQQLTDQTLKYLRNVAKSEAKLKKKLYKIDSTSAKRLFANSEQQYAALEQKITADTGGHRALPLNGEYRPYVDSLQGSLSFLEKNPQLLNSGTGLTDPDKATALQSSVTQFQQLQAKMNDADEAKAFIRQRKSEIGDYIGQHANLQAIFASEFNEMNQDLYYYSQQVRAYKEMLNNPDQLEQKALSLLDKMPAFQQFMQNHSQLSGMFNLPVNYGSSTALSGLQTRDQVSQIIQTQMASGGPGAAAALQSNLQSANQQLDQYKDKLSKLGAGSGDMQMPDFKPNEQKTKTFWKRLQFGTDLQTTRTNYYWPTISDIAVTIGYKLTNISTVGLGASYKIGWGTGINHIALSSQGAGLRSFLDVKIKGTWSASAGLEYNYTTLINSLSQIRSLSDWTQSGLIGVSKTLSVKNRVFKQTKMQLLWDFLSYQQIPKTQPLLFRVGYNF